MIKYQIVNISDNALLKAKALQQVFAGRLGEIKCRTCSTPTIIKIYGKGGTDIHHQILPCCSEFYQSILEKLTGKLIQSM